MGVKIAAPGAPAAGPTFTALPRARMRPLLLALALLAPTLVAAQRVPTPPRPPEPPVSEPLHDEAPGSSSRQRFVLAVQMLANGNSEDAIPLLEDVLADDPASVPVWLKLKDAYEATRRYDDLLALVDARIEREGRTTDLLAERGVALYRAGRTDDAERAWADAIGAAPEAEQTYRTVANAIGGLRLYVEAADVLDAGRERFGEDAFLLERAHLYGLGLDYERAVALYLQLLADQPEHVAGVRARLTRLLDGQDAPALFAAAVDRAIALDPFNRAYRELSGWLALERGDYDAALDAIRALDRLEQEDGQTLVAFAQQAASAGSGEAAARAFDEVLERHAGTPAATVALLERARLWDEAARADRESASRGATPAADAARALYRQWLDGTPGAAETPAVQLALADLLRDVYRDFDGSNALLERAAVGRDPGVAARARLALGEVAVRRGDLDGARERFADVDEAIRIGPLAEQARYELALLDFYEGFMFSALARAEALDENTAADASNDAIALRVTLSETLDQDSPPDPDEDLTDDPLHVYARAALLHRRDLPEQALATLDTLDAALSGPAALGDEALYLRAAVLHQSGRAAEAVAVLDALAEQFPLSYFRDRALRLQARALEHDLGDPAGAARRYEELLERFGGSPYAPEAREALRRLRSSV